MQSAVESPTKILLESETTVAEYKTPSPVTQKDDNSKESSNELRKVTTPDRLSVPKAFKYPERYRSPTDSMMSPVTKGLLARNRKGVMPLPPSLNQTRIQEIGVKDTGLFSNENSSIEC